MRKKAGLNGYVYEFLVDYNVINISNIINIHKYLMKKHDITMFALIKNMLIVLLTGLVDGLIIKKHFVNQSEMSDSTYTY